jgi:hypothetical protein
MDARRMFKAARSIARANCTALALWNYYPTTYILPQPEQQRTARNRVLDAAVEGCFRLLYSATCIGQNNS